MSHSPQGLETTFENKPTASCFANEKTKVQSREQQRSDPHLSQGWNPPHPHPTVLLQRTLPLRAGPDGEQWSALADQTWFSLISRGARSRT